jgi:N-methylhydantoinase A/oxoprolinase/acetone carboxylase beta subunit
MTTLEELVYDCVDKHSPISWSDLFERLGKKMPMSSVLESLVKKRLIQPIGFTPTDALHILGDYDEWNAEASLIGAQKIDRLTHMSAEELAAYTKTKVARNMASSLIAYLVPGISKRDVEKVLSGNYHTKFAISVPIVLIGGPSKAYAAKIREIIQADVLTPDFADVGNAVGALVGNGICRTDVLIKMNIREEESAQLIDFIVFHGGHGETHPSYQDAYEKALQVGNNYVKEKILKTGLKENQINISHTEKSLQIGTDAPYETKISFVGVGTSRYDIQTDKIPDFVKFINPEKSKRI